MQLGPIRGYLQLVDQFTLPLAKARAQVSSFEKSFGGLGEIKLFSGMTSTQIALLAGEFIALSAAVGAAVRTYSDFEKSMDAVGAIAEASTAQLGQMTEAALELGRGAQFSANEVARGMEDMARAGFSVQQTIEVMPVALNLATAAQEKLGHTSMILARALATYGIDVTNASIAADALTASANATNTSITNLATGMRYIGPVAAVAGISIQDTAAAMGVLADAGMDASLAGTGLRRIFSELAAPTKQATKALGEMGLSLEDVDLPTKGIIGVLENLKLGFAALPNDTERAGAAFKIFGDRGAPAILAITNQLDRLRQVTEQVRNSAGVTAEVAGKMVDNLAGDWAKFKNNLNDVLLLMGGEMNEGLRDLVQSLTELLISLKPIAETIGFVVGKFAEFLSVVAEVVEAVTGFTVIGINPLSVAIVALTVSALLPLITNLATLSGAFVLSAAKAIAAAGAFDIAANGMKGIAAAFGTTPLGLLAIALAAAGYAANQWAVNSGKAHARAMADMVRTGEAGNALRATLQKAFDEPMKIKLIDVDDAERQLSAIVDAYKAAALKMQQTAKGDDTEAAEEARRNFEATREQMELAQRQYELIATAYDNYAGKLEQKKIAELQAKQAAAAHAEEVKKLLPSLQSLIGKYDEIYAVTVEQAEGYATLTKAVGFGMTDAIQNYTSVLASMNVELAKTYAENGQLEKGLGIVTASWAAGRMNALEYSQALFEVWLATNEGKEALKKAEKAYKDAAEAAEDLRKEQEKLANENITKLVSGYKNLWELEQKIASDSAISEAAKKGAAALREATIAADTHDFVMKNMQETLTLTAEGMAEYEKRVRAVMTAQYDAANSANIFESMQEDWAKFKDNLDENFVKGIQDSLSGLFEGVFSGATDSAEEFIESLKDLFFKAIAEVLSRWLMMQAARHLDEMRKIAIEAAARKMSAKYGGTGPVSSGADYATMLGGGGAGGWSAMFQNIWAAYGGAIVGVAVVAAAAAIGKYQKDRREAQRYGTEVWAGAGIGGDWSANWRGKLTETGKKAADAIRAVMLGLQEVTGVLATSMESIAIRIRNDKKAFMVLVGGEMIGYFHDLNSAIMAAVKESFFGAEGSGAIPTAMREAIEGFHGDDPAQLIENLRSIKGLLDELSGLSDLEIEIGALPQKTRELTMSLREMGVSMEEAKNLSSKWRAMQMSDLRDQITGAEKTTAQLREEFERKRALFNAELVLWEIQLTQEIARLEARLKISEVNGGLIQREIDQESSRLDQLGQLLSVESDLYNAEIQTRGWFVGATAEIFATSRELLEQQLASLREVLANLPKPIGASEFKLPGGGGGGKAGGGAAAGPSKADRLETLRDELAGIAQSLLPSLVGALMDLDEWLAATTKEALALGYPLEEINRLYAAQRAELEQQARAEVQQYLQSGFQRQMQDILAWGVEMRAVYTQLGLSLDEVEQAEAARLAALQREIETAVGLPQVEEQWLRMAEALEILKQQLADGVITAEDYAAAIESAGRMATIALVDSLLRFVDDEQAKLALEQMRWAMEIANMQLQLEYVRSLGILTAEQIAMVEALLGQVIAAGPPTSAGGGYSGGGGGGGGNDLADAANALRDAAEALLDYVNSLKQNETLSPLTLGQRFALAQQEYLAGLALAQQWWLPDEQQAEYINALPDLASQYLELAAQMFGTSSAGYQTIFEAVTSALEALATQVAGGTTGWEHFWGYADVWSSAFESMNAFLMQINEGIEDLEPVVQDPGGTQESIMYQVTARGSEMLAADMTARAVQEGTRMIAEEVGRTGDEAAMELRAIRTVLQRQAVRPSAFERRIESGQITGRRRSVA